MEIIEFVRLSGSQGRAALSADEPFAKVMGIALESVAVFIAGALPPGMIAQEAVEGVISLSLGEKDRDTITSAAGPMALIRVAAISDESPIIKAALTATLYEKVPLGSRLFLTGPIHTLKPPLNEAMVCLVGQRRQ